MEDTALHCARTLDLSLSGEALPNGIYTIPEVSMVGETEESFKKKGIAYPGFFLYNHQDFYRSFRQAATRLNRASRTEGKSSSLVGLINLTSQFGQRLRQSRPEPADR